jgi:phage-related protein
MLDMGWTVEMLNKRVDEELLALPEDMQARFAHIVELLESGGIQAAHGPHVKSLGRGLFEMRMKGRDGIARAVYVHAIGARLVVVLVFVKKSQKTPKSIIDLAFRRAKEVR